MILVGQFDSPFVRRVAVTLHHYHLRFERNRLSVFNPAMVDINPLMRVPALIIDGDETLYDSAAIIDYLDELAGPQKALIPRNGDERRRVLQALALATGAIEKAIAVVYERQFHAPHGIAHEWTVRCMAQLSGALVHLDAHAGEPWYFGRKFTQADITLGCLVGYLRLRLQEAFPPGLYPDLERLSERCEALDAFAEARPAPDELMPAKP
ncbi:MAG: glutathione S-transferase family protein [Parvibaculaceae bacterium]